MPLDLSLYKPAPGDTGDATEVSGAFTTIEQWANGNVKLADLDDSGASVGQVPVFSGTAWAPGASATSGGTLVTALPGSASDGQIITLTDSLTAPTYMWQLRYVAAVGKWFFLGGSALRAADDGAVTTATTATWQDLGGSTVTIPVAGVYRTLVSALTLDAGAVSGTFTRRFGVTVNGVSPPVSPYDFTNQVPFDEEQLLVQREVEVTRAAGDVLKLIYFGNASPITATFSFRRISVTPVKLG